MECSHNLHTEDKYGIIDVEINKSSVYRGEIANLIKHRKEKQKNGERPLAAAVLGINNTSIPLPENTEFFLPNTYLDAQELFIETKPSCYLILGKPGAGSYVLGAKLAKCYNCIHLCPKNILEDEIAQNSNTGRCINFNMRRGRVITFDILMKILKIKLDSAVIQHRGYVISGFPLVTCLRSQKFLINSLSSEESVLVVEGILLNTILNLKKKKGKVPLSTDSAVTLDSSDIEDLGENSEEEESELEEELVNEEEDVKVELPKFILDTCSNLIECSHAHYTTMKVVLLQQINELLNLKLKPDIIINLTGSDNDMMIKKSHCFIDYRNAINIFKPFIPLTSSEIRWPLQYSTRDYVTPADIHKFNLKYLIRQPNNFKHKVIDQMCNYKKDILCFLTEKLKELDPKFVLKIDARLSSEEMMHNVSQKLTTLPIKPVIVPQPLYLEESPENVEEFWEIIKNLVVVHNGTKSFSRTTSPWLNRCPVELKKRHSVKGNLKYSVAFLKHVYLLSSLENFILFCKNPCPYLKLEYLEPTCRIIVMGTNLSGKTMISECLSWLFDAPIIDFNEIYYAEKIKKYDMYSKTILSEIIATIEDARLAEWKNNEMERQTSLEQWCETAIVTLQKYVLLLKEYLNGDKVEEPADVDIFMSNFYKLRVELSFLPFLDDLNECENALSFDILSTYAPKALKIVKAMPPLPILGDKDVTEAISAYIEANDLHNEIMPTTDEMMHVIKESIHLIDGEKSFHNSQEKIYGKYIIDGFPADIEYWNVLVESNLLPDNTISLLENKEIEKELIEIYKNIKKSVKNHKEKYILADDPLIKIKLQKSSHITTVDNNIYIKNILNYCFDSACLKKEENKFNEEQSWLLFSEDIEKFKQGWDSVKLKIEDNNKCFIEVYLETKSDVEIIEEVLLKLRKSYNLACEIAEAEEEFEYQDEVDKNMLTYNNPQNFGETGAYCPISYYKHKVLWEGNPELSVKFDGKLYRISKEENLNIFHDDPTKYQCLDKLFKLIPPLRICVIGCVGSGKTTISKLLAKELGLIHIDFAEIVNEMLIPRHFKKVGRRYENSFIDGHIDEASIVNFVMDEENETLLFDNIMSNEGEIRQMVFNYFEKGSHIYPQIMQKLITKFWLEDPFNKTGFVLDGYPKLSSDIEDMTTCYCIPDLIIELECSSENAINRLVPIMMKTWKMQLSEAKEIAKNKLNKEKLEWLEFITKHTVAKLIIEEIFDVMFASSEQKGGLSAESVIIDANPSGSIIDVNLFHIYNNMVEKFPEPIDHSEWETAEDVRDRMENRIESILEVEEENIQALKEVLLDQRIKFVTLDGNKPLEHVTCFALEQLATLRNRNDSFFETTLCVTPDIAELLVLEGFCFPSYKFNRMCPVFIYENPNAIFSPHSVSKKKDEAYPVIHRSSLYFVSSSDSLKKFRQNPLKYVTSDNICDFKEYQLRIGVIGSPKSGKSIISAKLSKLYDLLCLSRGTAVRNMVERFYWTELGTKMLLKLNAGESLSTEEVMKAVQTMTMDYRATTNGYVFDGFPETAAEAIQLDQDGIYPNLIIHISADRGYVLENSQKEIYHDFIKRMPPYSRPFLDNRYNKWEERAYSLRDWIQNDYQNLYTIDGNLSKWECLEQANGIIKDFIPKVHNYLDKVKTNIVPVHFMNISNAEFKKRMSSYEHLCPLCLQNNILNHNLDPVIKSGIVEFRASRVPVPDERFDFLVEYHKPASKVPAFLNVVDIAGLVRGAAEGQGLGNAFLSHIKACDAIFNLVRAFDDEDVIHVDGDVNPVRDLETIGEELRLKDEEQLMAQYEKLERTVSRGGDKKLKPEFDALTRIKQVLVDEKKHIRFGDWSAADIEVLNKYLFLTSKPALYLVNLSEKDYIRKKNKWLPKLKEWIDKNDPGAPLIPFSGILENKLMEMDPEERKAYLKEHNATSALEKIIVQGYKALNLEYFFTAGPDEVKAWTIQKGTKAPQAAGRIHTDFEKGFIMAEVMHFKDFKEEGSEAACKSAGKYRQQGRNYVVEDGDIIFFKFNAGAGLKDAKKK